MSVNTEINKIIYLTPKSPQNFRNKETLLKSSEYDHNIKAKNIHTFNEMVTLEEEVKFPKLSFSPKKIEDNVRLIFIFRKIF